MPLGWVRTVKSPRPSVLAAVERRSSGRASRCACQRASCQVAMDKRSQRDHEQPGNPDPRVDLRGGGGRAEGVSDVAALGDGYRGEQRTAVPCVVDGVVRRVWATTGSAVAGPLPPRIRPSAA